MSPSDLPNRRSIRLRGYDYTNQGAYFVTICVRHRELLLGDIVDGEAVLSDAGHCVDTTWNTLPDRFPTMDIDAYVIMPNHVHGIILLGARECEQAAEVPDPPLATVVGHSSRFPDLPATESWIRRVNRSGSEITTSASFATTTSWTASANTSSIIPQT